MYPTNNDVPTSFCLIGDLGSEAVRNDLLAALLNNGFASFIYLQSALVHCESLPNSLEPFVETWSFIDEASDVKIGQDLPEIYPLLYQDALDKNKYSRLFDVDIPSERVFRKPASSFREKMELFDIYTAVILKTPVLAYVNMKDNLKMFSQENQLRLRRHGMSILSEPQHESLITSQNWLYSVRRFKFTNNIPLYPLFTEWLKTRMTCDLHITFINREESTGCEK